MDRRQRKTREAIFEAFTQLLAEKKAGQITVGEIIDRADVGRATFYAHFETKDFLLKELCGELFGHIFDSMGDKSGRHKYIFDCDAPNSVFLHLFYHLQKNDHSILQLLAGQNNEPFLRYFKEGLVKLVDSRVRVEEKGLPREFLVNHIASSFVETVKWWIDHGMEQPPEEITLWFLSAAGLEEEMQNAE